MLERYYAAIDGDTKEIRVDLHMHSTASDGTWIPGELVKKVADAGIKLFSLTDHDTVKNVAETAAQAEKAGLFFIPGVEIGALWEGRVYHILGFGVDVCNPLLLRLLREHTEQVEETDEQSVVFLEGLYPHVSRKEYLEYEDDRTRGGWKALNYLIDKGLCKNYKDFFKLFRGNSESIVAFDYYPPEEVCRVIKEAGGRPVLAHPGASFYDPDYKAVLEYMKNAGIQGVECYHPENGPDITQYALEFCRANGLMVTGGSDCHGDFLPMRRLGLPDIRLADLTI